WASDSRPRTHSEKLPKWPAARREFLLPPASSLQIGERASVLLGERRSRLRLLEALPHVRRTQHFHAEERIAARRIQTGCAARVDQRRVHRDAGTEGPAQGEAAPRLCRIGDEHALLGADSEN